MLNEVMYLFFKLGAKNAWRNLARSLLAIISMGFASAFLAYVLTLGRGYSQGAGQPLRQMLGGEISVYQQKLVSELPSNPTDFEFSIETLNPFTDLSFFYTGYEQKGYMTGSSMDDENWLHLEQQLLDQPSISGVYPVYRLPAFEQFIEGSGESSIVSKVSLYGKGLNQENMAERSLASYVDSGRWFEDSDDNRHVAVISTNQVLPPGVAGHKVGDMVQIEIPRIVETVKGKEIDWLNPITVDFEIIGSVALHTRDVDFFVVGELKTEQIHGYHNDIYIPLSTWKEIWGTVALEQTYLPGEYILQVDTLTYLEDIVYTLREQYPNIQVNSIPVQNEWMLNQFLIEPEQAFSRVPAARLSALKETKQANTQGVIIADLRVPIVTLVLFNAALLLTANILILIIERKREMAVLKSIGAKKADIVTMIMSEAVLITFLGASSGYLIVSIPNILNQFSNSVSGLQIVWGVLLNSAYVLTITCGCAALFSFVPGLQIASKSVMEVLRDE